MPCKQVLSNQTVGYPLPRHSTEDAHIFGQSRHFADVSCDCVICRRSHERQIRSIIYALQLNTLGL